MTAEEYARLKADPVKQAQRKTSRRDYMRGYMRKRWHCDSVWREGQRVCNAEGKRKACKKLNRSYVLNQVCQHTQLKCADIPPALVEAKRAEMTLSRLLRSLSAKGVAT